MRMECFSFDFKRNFAFGRIFDIRINIRNRHDSSGQKVSLCKQLLIGIILRIHQADRRLQNADIGKQLCRNLADIEQQAKITEIQNSGQEIEDAMSGAGVRSQTIKAQLIYMSYFGDVQNFNAESYANLFAVAPNDSDLITAINSTYGLEIGYDEFMRTYTWVMNSTINGYMFSDESTKNCADLAAWAENAYISGWGFKQGAIGNRDYVDRIRYADNAGLMLGYLNYNPDEKSFGNQFQTLVFTEQGSLDTMPEVAGIGLFDGSQHGIYVGDGEVIYCSESAGYVTKDLVSNGGWTSWCTYEGVDYPQEVRDKIDENGGDSE